MRVTIVKPDNIVLIGGIPREIELSGYPSLEGVRVVQWDEDVGHIEFDNYKATHKDFKINEPITSLDPYADIIQAWHAKGSEKV